MERPSLQTHQKLHGSSRHRGRGDVQATLHASLDVEGARARQRQPGTAVETETPLPTTDKPQTKKQQRRGVRAERNTGEAGGRAAPAACTACKEVNGACTGEGCPYHLLGGSILCKNKNYATINQWERRRGHGEDGVRKTNTRQRGKGGCDEDEAMRMRRGGRG